MILSTTAALLFFSADIEVNSKAWVTSDRLQRRTCPDVSCGIVGQLFFREVVIILERKGDWVRVSKYYDASCRKKRSEYVDSGNSRCVPKNGIVNDKFAEWAEVSSLSVTRPAEPAAGVTGDYALIKGSDDFQKYKDVFATSARKLIAEKKCSAKDFEDMGGWVKSSNYRYKPIYFTYCGGMRKGNKLYLNAESGKVTR